MPNDIKLPVRKVRYDPVKAWLVKDADDRRLCTCLIESHADAIVRAVNGPTWSKAKPVVAAIAWILRRHT